MTRHLQKLRLRLRSLFRSSGVEQDLSRELRAHVDEETAHGISRGLSHEDARQAALKAFGSLTSVADDCRDTRRVRRMENVVRDVRYGVRMLAARPGLVAAAATSLALGVGANLTIFSLANSLLLAVPTADRPDELVHIRMNNGSHVSYPAWRQLHESGALASVAGYDFEGTVNWRDGQESTTLVPLLVTANFFDTLRIPMALGRGFAAGEAHPDRQPHLVVISHSFWRRHLHSDPAAVGRPLWLNGEPYAVTGVLPDKFRSIAGAGLAPDVYLPFSRDLVPSLDRIGTLTVQSVGRLRAGQSVAGGHAALGGVVQRMSAEPQPEFTAIREFAPVGSLSQIGILDLEEVSAFFLVLFIVSGLVLAIACANVAGLLLARGLSRRREIALRISLGASRGRLVQQLLIESLMLTITGALGGAAVCAIAFAAASRISLPVTMPVELHFALDWRTMALATGLVAIGTILTGLAPALQATRPALLPAIKLDERALTTRRLTGRSLMVAGQVAVSVVLLVAALLFLRSLRAATTVTPGFDVDSVIVARVSFVEGRQGSPDRYAIEEIAARVRAVPGVTAVALAGGVPLTMSAGSWNGSDATLDGAASPVRVEYSSNYVSADYFTTMGISVLQGRNFSDADRRDGARPIIIPIVINTEFARRYFHGRNPVGLRIRDVRGPGSTNEVVGVVSNGKYRSLSEKQEAAIYEPFLRGAPQRQTHLLIRTTGTPDAVIPAVRDAMLAADGSLAVTLTPMRTALAFAMLPSRIGSMLLGVMGAVGTMLAMVGLFGIVSFTVSRRTAEIAIRMALGASRTAVLMLVLRQTGRLIIGGVVAGLVLAWMATMPLSAFLVSSVRTTDPWSFAGAALLLMLASFAAVWGPAIRAIGIAPWKALRLD